MGVATAGTERIAGCRRPAAKEFRSLGAIVSSPQADSLPLEIGGVDYRPVKPARNLCRKPTCQKLKTIFWHNNIIGSAPVLEVPAKASQIAVYKLKSDEHIATEATTSWHVVPAFLLPSGWLSFVTGHQKTNPWWSVERSLVHRKGLPSVFLVKRFAMRNSETYGGTILFTWKAKV